MSVYTYNYSYGKFLDLKTHFGFQKIFCNKSDTGFLHSFINAVLEGKHKFNRISLLDPKQITTYIPSEDVAYAKCREKNGDTYLVILYGTYYQYRRFDNIIIPLIKRYHKKASKDGIDRSYKEVISIRIEPIHLKLATKMNYIQTSKSKISEEMEEYKSTFDSDSGIDENESLHIDHTVIRICLPWFDKSKDVLETMLDKWLYSFKYLSGFGNRPEFTKAKIFERLLRSSEVYFFPEEETEQYTHSLFHWWEYKEDKMRKLETMYKECYRRGFKEGCPKGFEEGFRQGYVDGYKQEFEKAVLQGRRAASEELFALFMKHTADNNSSENDDEKEALQAEES